MTEAMGWIGYSMVVAALFGGAALALEVGLRQLGRPVRAPWLLALAGSVLLPLVADLRPVPAAGAALALPAMSLPGLEVTSGVASGFDATSYLLLAWVVLSAGVLLLVVRAHLELVRAARSWRQLELDGGAVWVSARLGPAVVGVVRPRVVVPEWVLALPADARSLLLLHEREHARAGDARLVAGAFLAALAMPWNPLVWWQVARLRHAIELDCDARVLARGGPVRSYGALLLEVGRRRSEQPLLAAAFAERTSRLERRIRALVEHTRACRPVRGALLALLGTALLGTAYCVRDPLAGNPGAGETVVVPVEREARKRRQAAPAGALPAGVDTATLPRRVSEVPSFTPMTQQPELRNGAEVQRALVANYPPLLRDAGVDGVVTVWLLIDETGVVRRTQVSRTSGRGELDEAALRVARTMRFTPAGNHGTQVPVWVEIPIRFEAN